MINKSTKNSENKSGEIEVIYKGQQNLRVRNIKIVSLATSAFNLGLQPIVYHKVVEAGTVTKLAIPLTAFLGLFAVFTPLLLHLVTKKYILSIEYLHQQDKYVAIVYSLFARKKRVSVSFVYYKYNMHYIF